MFTYFKKHIYAVALVLFYTLVSASGVFAQSVPIENIVIDKQTGLITGAITQPSSTDTVELVVELTSPLVSEEIYRVDWEEGVFSFNLMSLGSYEISDIDITGSNNVSYRSLEVRSVNAQGEVSSESLQAPLLSTLITEDASKNVVVGISWTSVDLKQNDNRAWFYVFSSNGPAVREDKTQPVFVNIARTPKDGGTPEPITLCVIPPGLKAFNIEYPQCFKESGDFIKELDQSPFIPGYTYELYLSDSLNGTTILNDGLDKTSRIDLPDIPDPASTNTGANNNPSTTQNPSSTTQTPTTGTVGAPSGNLNTPVQQNIIDKGIAISSCGYDLGSEGSVMCGFNEFITLIQNVIEYIFILVLPIAAIVFAYAGFLFLTSGGNAEKRKAAKKAMVSVIIGVLIVMVAWIAVRTVLSALGVNPEESWFYLAK